jgi:hypothetical protein
MKRKGQRKACLSIGLFLWIVFSVMGCAQSGGSGFLKKEFSKYENIAVLPFEGDDTGQVAKAFARNFQKRFPQISMLGGRQFLDNPPEEKLNLNQLDDATRLKIGRRVGAQALITGMIYSPGILSWYLQVKIIDNETGEVLGRSMVQVDSLFATDIEKAARSAVEKLSWW